ncbi:hypothetical protein [Aquimarina sp. AU474]|uniref:hypothetical protein n=1 Tax=Aquimarina sp. AU474 TaxID=2108529 RepID=UPI000D6997B8|nr:hypothetical protein [Aquimarina sp. AU474]
MEDSENEISNKLADLEVRLLEQEHRPLIIIKNFINRRQWPKNDPRRKAVFASMIWRLFFSPAVIAASGGFIALVSLGVLVWQTTILREQNNKIVEQNYLVEAQRRSSLQFELSEIFNRIDQELVNDKSIISQKLKSRIIAVTISMKPYKSFDGDTLSESYSYEKGHLFAYLINSGMSAQDLNSILSRSNFTYMRLENVVLGLPRKFLKLSDFKFKNCYLKNVGFYNMEFSHVLIENSTFVEVNMETSFSLYLKKGSRIIHSSIAYEKGDMPLTIRIQNSSIENSKIRSHHRVIIMARKKENQIIQSQIRSNELRIGVTQDASKLILSDIWFQTHHKTGKLVLNDKKKEKLIIHNLFSKNAFLDKDYKYSHMTKQKIHCEEVYKNNSWLNSLGNNTELLEYGYRAEFNGKITKTPTMYIYNLN